MVVAVVVLLLLLLPHVLTLSNHQSITYSKRNLFIFSDCPAQESFEGQMTEDNIELGVCDEQGFRRLTPSEVKDYLASIIS